jgi:hypothetical protein
MATKEPTVSEDVAAFDPAPITEQGVAAREAGLTETVCPYTGDLRDIWLAGYAAKE